MNEPNRTPLQTLPEQSAQPGANPVDRRLFFASILILLAGFSVPLFRLGKFSLSNDLYSHVLLVPLVSLYLIWSQRKPAPLRSAPNRILAVSFLIAGAALLASPWIFPTAFNGPWEEDYLAPRILALILFLSGTCAWFLGRQRMLSLAFPLGFLIFMVPFPEAIRHGLETFLQHGSAAAAYALFKISGATFFYSDLIFRLPGINLEVAPECSGIRSSLALFITSVLAGHFFLRTPWKSTVLCLAVIPLALVRNGFRIFTIGELCVRISPDMIDSYLHHKGGPIFFALSLIPFFFLLRYLFKSERRNVKKSPTTP